MTATPTAAEAAAFSRSSTESDDSEYRRFRAGFLACLRSFPVPRVRQEPGTWSTTPGPAGLPGRSYRPGRSVPIDEEVEALFAYQTWVAAGRP